MTKMNNIGFQRQKIQKTSSPTRTRIQQRILRELRNLQETEKLNPNDNEASGRKLLSNSDWRDSMLQQHEIKRIESLLVEFYDSFARLRFDIGMHKEFMVKLTPKYSTPAYRQISLLQYI